VHKTISSNVLSKQTNEESLCTYYRQDAILIQITTATYLLTYLQPTQQCESTNGICIGLPTVPEWPESSGN